ncbi:alpha/beta-hydrolase [Polyporus arcularius HHB13444]|uniref:Alpha/beta-hydrolase n=1 Tax=Polyporus arcularius HHB13444 TaxID=1314778 RepID=A0A5C3PAQ1_9APHY|nr:alpha/beta-hydrolase [Polyporus arcularius HHB13444]
MGPLIATNVVIPSSTLNGLDVAATRYSPQGPFVANRTQISLLFTHGVSFHKELWLPTIEHIFDLQKHSLGELKFVIVEAWTVDLPNHGQSAIINHSRLVARPDGISAYESARAVEDFLAAHHVGAEKLVAIGHSAGACVLPLSTIGRTNDTLPYSSMILVEPPMMTQEVLDSVMRDGKAWKSLIGMAKSRKDTWPSREAARAWMSMHIPWKAWESRCVDLFVQYGLRDLSAAGSPSESSEGVTLCCSRVQEVAGYAYVQDGVDSLNRLKFLCSYIPVHCVFGESADVVHKSTQVAIVDPKQGRTFKSVARVPRAGHLVIQENPRGLAEAIWAALQMDYAQEGPTSRL